MKNVQKIIITALVFVAMTVTLAVSAAAMSPECTFIADDLKALGLFGGTDKGYELERVPSRVEASVMLIRLLGKEKDALAGTYKHPFTDVPAWANKYIAYMYEKKLTGGVGGDKFGSATVCSAQMFATFLLRSIGYSDAAGDFTYVKALDAAVEFDAIDESTIAQANKDGFNRGYMVFFSGDALYAKVKGSDKQLIEKLNDEGALNAQEAPRFVQIYKAFYQINHAKTPQYYNKEYAFTETYTDAEGPHVYYAEGESSSVNVNEDGSYEETCEGATVTSEGEQDYKYYYKDGWNYYEDSESKTKYPDSEPDSNYFVYTLSSIKSATVSTDANGDTTIHLTLDPERIWKLIEYFGDSIKFNIMKESGATKLNEVAYDYVIDANGCRKSIISYANSNYVDAENPQITALTFVWVTKYESSPTALPLAFPDFSQFKEE